MDQLKSAKFFGCGKMESKMGSTGIDTMAVIENGDQTILNVNDCPFLLSTKTLDVVRTKSPTIIDLLLVGYAGAGEAILNVGKIILLQKKLEVYGPKKKLHFLNMGKQYIDKIKPNIIFRLVEPIR